MKKKIDKIIQVHGIRRGKSFNNAMDSRMWRRRQQRQPKKIEYRPYSISNYSFEFSLLSH